MFEGLALCCGLGSVGALRIAAIAFSAASTKYVDIAIRMDFSQIYENVSVYLVRNRER